MPNSDKTVTFREITELSDLVVTGELSLQETGRIVTSTAITDSRVVITATGKARIEFYGGTTGEGYGMAAAGPGSLQLSSPTPAGSTSPASLQFLSGNTATQRAIFVGHVLPVSNAAYDLGSTDQSWRNLYLTGDIMSTAGVPIIDQSRMIGPTTFDPDFGILTGTTAPTVGTGADALESGVYTQMGSQVIGHFTLRWSSNGSSGNGTYRIRVPKKPASTLPLNPSLGSGRIFSSTANREWLCDIRMNTSKQAIFRMGTTGGLNVTDNVPAIWVNSSDNRITGHLSYLTTE